MANEELKKRNLNSVLQTAYEQFLNHGIENTTKEMLARASGLSRASLNRYFVNKTDCVLQTSEWIGHKLRDRNSYLYDMLDSGKYTGSQMLEHYLNAIKELYFESPYIYVLVVEIKAFVFRNCADREKAYMRLTDALGNHELLEKIFSLGKSDGSFPADIDVHEETVFLSEFYRELLADISLTMNPTEKGKRAQIDRFIARMMRTYRIN